MKLTGVQDLTHRIEQTAVQKHWLPMKVEELLIFAVLVLISTLSGCIVYSSSSSTESRTRTYDCSATYKQYSQMADYAFEQYQREPTDDGKLMWAKVAAGFKRDLEKLKCQ